MPTNYNAFAAFAAILLLGTSSAAQAEDVLNVMSYGGNYQKSQEVYFNGFTKETGVKVAVESADEAWPKVNAMVEAGNITWDVVQGETSTIIQNCDNGNLEPFDWSLLDKSAFVPIAVQKCGVGTIISSSIIAFNADKFPSDPPKSVADFWNVEKYPGKRGMRKKAITTLEFALLADGVATADVYNVLRTEEGVTRAFKKLDAIKSNIVWWESSSSAPQLLGSGEVSMSTGWNGRITAAKKTEGKNFIIIWDGQIYDGDFFAVVKGSPHKDLAQKFIALASQPEFQAKQIEQITYGPTVKKTLELLPAEALSDLPTAEANLKSALPSDAQFWAENGEALETRFIAWLNAS
jgi:putative spermidine/putrescine transport system substrate-binding protein